MQSMTNRNHPLWKRLYREACRTRAIDCHAHTVNEAEYKAALSRLGLFFLLGYFNRDLHEMKEMQGLSLDACATDESRWKTFKRMLDLAGNESYYRHLWHMYRELYGLGNTELNDRNWRAVHRRIQDCARRPGWYRYLLKERAGIDLSVYNAPMTNVPSSLDSRIEVTRRGQGDYTVSSVGVVELVALADDKPIRKLEKETGLHVRDARALREALHRFLRLIKQEGAVAIKSQHAYSRTLFHERVTDRSASVVLGRLRSKRSRTTADERRRLQDFIFWTLCEQAGECGLVFQIHTGLQGTLNRIPDSHPMHLLEPLKTFQRTRFDLFHAGYPYSIELGVIAKHYPNVWLNMAWMYVITMEGSRRVLDEWIDLVPGYRLLGFGSDVGYPELVVSHVDMARLCLADVLAKKVVFDLISEERAVHLIHQLLRNNAIDLYGLRGHPALAARR